MRKANWRRGGNWMFRGVSAAVFAVLGLGLVSCATKNVGSALGVSTTQNYVGRLASHHTAAVVSQTPLVAFIVAPKDDGRDVRAYVCDGQADGEVLWIRGAALPVPREGAKAAATTTFAFDLTSPAGYQVSGTISPGSISGELRGDGPGTDDNIVRDFTAALAPEGTGVFDLTVDASGNVSGKSLTGDQLALSKSTQPLLSVGDGRPFIGTLTTADGTKSDLVQVDLSTLSAEDLGSKGFPAAFAAGTPGVEPGNFRAIVLSDGEEFTSYGRLLLPGTGVNGVPPQFGSLRIVFSSVFRSLRL